MTLLSLLKSLLDDFVRYRWRDCTAIFLIAFGFWVILHSQDAMARGEAKGIIGAGLIMLDPRALVPGGTGKTNGTAALPPETPPAKAPEGWEPRTGPPVASEASQGKSR